MALSFQRIPISFVQGLDTKSDPKQLAPGKLLELENGVFVSPGQVKKRRGLHVTRPSIEGGDSFSTGSALMTFGKQLLVATGEGLFSRLPSTERWLRIGSATSVVTRTDQVIRNSFVQHSPDVAHLRGIELHAWEDSRGGVRFSARDADSRGPITHDAVANAVAGAPRCASFAGSLFLFYGEGNALKYHRLFPSVPSVLGSEVTLASDLASGSQYSYDLVTVGERLFVGYADTDGSTSVRYLDPALSVSPPVSLSGSGPIALWSDPSQNVHVAHVSGSVLFGHSFTYALTSLMTGTVLDPSPGAVANVTGLCASGSLSSVYYEVTGSRPTEQRIKVVSMQPGAVGSPHVFKRSVGLASKAWGQGNTHYLAVVHPSELQATYFVVNADAEEVSKANAQLGGGLRTSRTLSHVPAVAPGVYRLAAQAKSRFVTDTTDGRTITAYTPLGITSTRLDFVSSSRFFTGLLANNLHVGGGILGVYDGVRYKEQGFNVYPEGLSSAVVGSGGNVQAGTYQYVATYEQVDAVGQVHRSAPSIPIDVTVPGDGSSVAVTVPTNRLTRSAGLAQVVLYRTHRNGGDNFQRVTSIVSGPLNDPTVDSITIVDRLSDAALDAGEYLYTTGGVLENFPAPPCELVAVARDRVWVVGEDQNTLHYSKLSPPEDPRSALNPVAFHPALTVQVEPVGGPITAIMAMDDKLVVFKRDRIYVVSGEGRDNRGDGQDFFVNLITTAVGCVNPSSVVVTAQGLMFQSEKGIYLLTRSLEEDYVGRSVERFNRLAITSATHVADNNQVRFTTTDVTLVYDYAVGEWATFDGGYLGAVDSDVWDGTYVLLRGDGRLAEEAQDSWTDDGRHVRLKAVLGWVAWAGLAGYQRVRRVTVVGDYRGAHRLRVRFGFDYNPSFSQEATVDTAKVMALSAYGEDTPYGAGVYGGEFPLYMFDIDVGEGRGRNRAMRVSIEDVQDSGFNEGLSLSGLVFEVGVIPGGARLGANRKAGAR